MHAKPVPMTNLIIVRKGQPSQSHPCQNSRDVVEACKEHGFVMEEIHQGISLGAFNHKHRRTARKQIRRQIDLAHPSRPASLPMSGRSKTALALAGLIIAAFDSGLFNSMSRGV